MSKIDHRKWNKSTPSEQFGISKKDQLNNTDYPKNLSGPVKNFTKEEREAYIRAKYPPDIEIWTDGSCAPSNPGWMGAAFLIKYRNGNDSIKTSKFLGKGTSPKAEEIAIDMAMNRLSEADMKSDRIVIYTDCTFAQSKIAKKAPMNVDVRHVTAHSGNPENEECDRMAKQAIVDAGYEINPKITKSQGINMVECVINGNKRFALTDKHGNWYVTEHGLVPCSNSTTEGSAFFYTYPKNIGNYNCSVQTKRNLGREKYLPVAAAFLEAHPTLRNNPFNINPMIMATILFLQEEDKQVKDHERYNLDEIDLEK